MFDKNVIVPVITDTLTFYESTFALIKNDLCNIANTYLEIAFKVYEIDQRIHKDGKKCKYKNVVEACERELGFKKSTTYNMLNIVNTYGIDPTTGKVNYYHLCEKSCYSYSQLVEMLSLGDEQRSEITPDTPVSAIRMLKKSNEKEKSEVFRTSGKSSAASEPSETFQTSGKIPESFEFSKFSIKDLEIDIVSDNNELGMKFNGKLVVYIDEFEQLFSDFQCDICPTYDESFGYLTSDEIEKYSPEFLEERFLTIITLYRRAYNAYYKRLHLDNESAV